MRRPDPEEALQPLKEAEAVAPLFPVWRVEERGVAPYALGHDTETLKALGKLVFQTLRSRLDRAAALMALGRPEEAGKLVKEALASKPHLTGSRFLFQERYRGRMRDPGRRARGLRCAGTTAGGWSKQQNASDPPAEDAPGWERALPQEAQHRGGDREGGCDRRSDASAWAQHSAQVRSKTEAG
jgi:hypothetical protein